MFSLILPFIERLLQTHASRMPSLTFSTNICCYWPTDQSKTVFKLIKDKKEIGANLLAAISL